MLRALHRRIPRFGFLTLFAAMLLFISVAGWAKWNVDLWREEEALLADFAKSYVDYSYVRESGHVGERWAKARTAPTPPKVWDPLVPYFSRIERFVFREKRAPRERVERVAALPYVRMVTVEAPPTRKFAPEAIAAKIGIEAPRLETPVVPNVFDPMPDGETIDADEASTLTSSFLQAWDKRQPAPQCGTAMSVTMASEPIRTFEALDDELHVLAVDGFVSLDSAESSRGYSYSDAGFQQTGRFDDPESAASEFEKGKRRMISFVPRDALRTNLETLGIEPPFLAILGGSQPVRVARIDERRVRFDLPAITIARPSADCVDEHSISLVARTDLDWELEAWRFDGDRRVGPLAPTKLLPRPSGSSYRGVLRREQGLVVTEAWTVDYVQSSLLGVPENFAGWRNSGVAKYNFSPGLDLSHVTPESLDAKMLPPRRELPWLRWYRVTFALSLALFAWVAIRRRLTRTRIEESGALIERAAA